MAAEDALNSALFHGTTQPDLKRIEPAVVHGGRSNWGDTGKMFGQSSREHAFATTDERRAWSFAEDSMKRTPGRVAPRTYVYAVNPHPEQRAGAFTELKEQIAPHFDVRDRIDIMPGRQGTIPINWRQFQDTHSAMDPNHPIDFPETGAERWAAQDRARVRFLQERAPGKGQQSLFEPERRVPRLAEQQDMAQANTFNHLARTGRAPYLD